MPSAKLMTDFLETLRAGWRDEPNAAALAAQGFCFLEEEGDQAAGITWHCTVPGPAGSVWEGARLPLAISFASLNSSDFRLAFPAGLFHPNVASDGNLVPTEPCHGAAISQKPAPPPAPPLSFGQAAPAPAQQAGFGAAPAALWFGGGVPAQQPAARPPPKPAPPPLPPPELRRWVKGASLADVLRAVSAFLIHYDAKSSCRQTR